MCHRHAYHPDLPVVPILAESYYAVVTSKFKPSKMYAEKRFRPLVLGAAEHEELMGGWLKSEKPTGGKPYPLAELLEVMLQWARSMPHPRELLQCKYLVELYLRRVPSLCVGALQFQEDLLALDGSDMI